MCSLELPKLHEVTTLKILVVFIVAIHSLSILIECKAVPVDLFTSGYDEIKRNLPPKSESPGLCPENLNNDNITNIKWFRYHNETNKCWHVDQRGPCGEGMIFYRIGDTDYGDCDCNFYYKCARPLIYWAEEKRCYFTNEQGPCKKEEWLVWSDEGGEPSARCKVNNCVYNQTIQPSRKDRYWFEHEGSCYMTMTRGFCPNPLEILYSKFDELAPNCHIGLECNLRKVRGASVRSAASSSQTPACLPGQKMDAEGRCRQIFRLSWWSVLSKK